MRRRCALGRSAEAARCGAGRRGSGGTSQRCWGSTLVGFAPAASAATPSCTSETRIWQGDFYTDVPSTPSGSTNCVLRKGMTSNAVYRLQYTLYICNGANSLDLDGIYGDETAAAVRIFQDRMHIGVDGTYGPQTRSAMYWSFNSKTDYYCGKI